MTLKDKLFPERAVVDSVADLRRLVWSFGDDKALQAQLEELQTASAALGRLGCINALREASRAPSGYAVNEAGVATVPVKGTIVPRARTAGLFRFFGLSATASEEIRDAVNAAVTDDRVSSIRLDIDTLGGAVLGLKEAADAIFSARDHKPTHAHVGLEGFSAGYYLASQAGEISAGAGAELGSIGTVMTIADYSQAAEREGVKVHVISTGKLKGAGAYGSEITDEQIAAFQARVDEMGEDFKNAIVRGRDMEKGSVDKIATGETFSAQKAMELGLIDSIVDPAAKPSTTTAPEGAQNLKEENMSEELSALQAELEKERARAEAAESALNAIGDGRKTSAIAQGQKEGRILPSMLGTVKAYAEHATEAELSAFIAALPVQTKPATEGGVPKQEHAEVDALVKSFASRMDVSAKYVRDALVAAKSDDGFSFTELVGEGEG